MYSVYGVTGCVPTLFFYKSSNKNKSPVSIQLTLADTGSVKGKSGAEGRTHFHKTILTHVDGGINTTAKTKKKWRTICWVHFQSDLMSGRNTDS